MQIFEKPRLFLREIVEPALENNNCRYINLVLTDNDIYPGAVKELDLADNNFLTLKAPNFQVIANKTHKEPDVSNWVSVKVCKRLPLDRLEKSWVTM